MDARAIERERSQQQLVEKLVGGGVKRFHASDVSALAQGDGQVAVTLHDGSQFALIDELLNVTIPGTTTVVPRNTLQRIQVAQA